MPPVQPNQILQLYIDDSGSRQPDRDTTEARRDGMNAFALGGIMVRADDTPAILDAHGAFCRRWKIDYPLHSTRIRGQQSDFRWLRQDPARTQTFLNELATLILSLPFTGIACAVHRPGYMDRYSVRYPSGPWLMCKTAFAILIERAAKFADRQGRHLQVFFEQTGRHEDRAIKAYMKELKERGMPFDGPDSQKYASLTADDFRRIVLGDPMERTKRTALCQIADLVLYPMVKGRYDPNYRPYREMWERQKLIDALIDAEERPHLGIKYSCFDGIPVTRKD